MSEADSGLPAPPEAPEWVQTGQWLLHHYRANKELLTRTPVIVAILLFTIGGYWWGQHESSKELNLSYKQLDVAKDRISFLGDQVAAYKDRLQGATPDQAAKEVASLRQNLDEATRKLQMLMPDNPRVLTKGQKDKLTAAGPEIRKHVRELFVFAWSIGDSPGYANDFVEQFKTMGIAAIGPIFSSCSNDQHGILVGLKDPDHPSPDAVGFTKTLEDIGFVVHHTLWAQPQTAMQDFDLFICSEAAATDQK